MHPYRGPVTEDINKNQREVRDKNNKPKKEFTWTNMNGMKKKRRSTSNIPKIKGLLIVKYIKFKQP